MKRNNQTDKQEVRSFYKMVFALIIPMALQNLINVGVSAADVIMLGKVGETTLSAASLAGQVQFIMTLIFFGLTSGACVLTAQYWGKKDKRTIEKIIGISLRMSLYISVFFTICVFMFPVLIMKIFSAEADVIQEGASYLRIVAFSYIIMGLTMVYLNIIKSVEKVIISTIVYSISLCVNVVLNAVLIFGLFNAPALGIRGAAIATVSARCVEFCIVIFYVKKVNKDLRFKLSDLLIKDKLLMVDFMKFALPVTLNELFWGAGTSTNAAIIGHLGKSVVAANSVIQVIRQLAMVIVFGLASATAITIGKAIGEGKQKEANLYAKRFVKLSILLGLCGAVVILCVPQLLKGYLALSVDAMSYLNMMTVVMAYFALAQSYNVTIIVGVLRAGGDTAFGLIIDMVTLWGFAIFFGWLAAFYWKLPIPFVYMIIMSDEVLKLPFSALRYSSRKWLKNVTRN